MLLDKKYHGYAGLKDYSFAKYINGELVLGTGDFPYDKTDADYIDKTTDYRIFRIDGFKHVLYKNGNSTVIIGRPALTTGDVIISFAYLFAFILLFSNLTILVYKKARSAKCEYFKFQAEACSCHLSGFYYSHLF